MRGSFLKAALCAAFALSAVLPAVAAPAGPDPLLTTGSLAGGGTYVIRRSDVAPVAAIALWYRAPASGFEAHTPVPGIGRLAAAAVAASAPITGTPLSRLISLAGGRLAVSSYPNSVAISVLVPADRAADVIRAMTVSYFAPVLTDAGLKIARQDIAEDAFFRSFNADDAIGDALTAALFSDGPAHQPAIAKPVDIGKISMERVRAFAERAFRPANAVLVVTGAVDASVLEKAVPGRTGAAAGVEPPLVAKTVAVPSPVATSGSENGAGFAWSGPAITDEREATALDFITDYLFRADTGRLQSVVAPTKSSLNGKYVTYHDPGVLIITISGGDVPAARKIVADALLAARAPMDAATFAAARSAFAYHILSDIQTPGELADTFGWYTVEGDPEYAPGARGLAGKYFMAVQSLTPEFVAQTVGKFLGKPGATVEVVAKTPEAAK
ncbi:MAG: hypothetical protein NVS2B17_19330 [Candidatus Velthaea sp.]